MRATGPLFRFDPGWLFIAAGLTVCAAGVLLPAQADLRALEEQLAHLQAEEARAYQRLAAHADFIDQVDRGEPAMIKRLAAAQLNLVPSGDTPLLLASHEASPVTGWIDSTLKLDIRPSRPEPLSTLSRWTSGPSRLWLFGCGMMTVFMGVLLGPGMSRVPRRNRVGDVVGIDGWEVGSEGGVATIEAASVGAASWPRHAHGDESMPARDHHQPRGRIDLWTDHDPATSNAAVIDCTTITATDLGVCDQHVSEVADTVDLEPEEVATAPWERVVIDDADGGNAASAAERDEAAGAITLTAHEIDALDSHETGNHHDAATVDLDWRETHDEHADADAHALSWAAIEAKSESLAERNEDDAHDPREANVHTDIQADSAGDPESDGADQDRDLEIVVSAEVIGTSGSDGRAASAPADDEPEAAATAVSAAHEPLTSGEAVDSDSYTESVAMAAAPVAAPPAGRRRPRRQKGRANDSAPQPEEIDDLSNQRENATDEVTAHSEGAQVNVGAVAGDAKDENASDAADDSVSDAAADIPFLRHRAGRDNHLSEDDNDVDSSSQRSQKSRSPARPRPRRRG